MVDTLACYGVALLVLGRVARELCGRPVARAHHLDAETHEVLYVGSSAGRLYDTLTRHLQTWRRYKGFWRGQFGEGSDPGLTYPRGDVEVAVRLTSPDDALDEEMRLIARLRPRDNQIGQPELEDAPF